MSQPLSPSTQAVIGSWKMENLVISPETVRDMQRLSAGEMTLAEALEQIRQRVAPNEQICRRRHRLYGKRRV